MDIEPVNIGIVAIGRNEGDRLKRCLCSLPADWPVVYVDSGSTDGSVAFAKSRGVEVVDLDLSIPFTAARARNAGFERLIEQHPDVTYVHFIDGDCELIEGWIAAARQQFAQDPRIAVICGRTVEKYPTATRYNQLADMEWDTAQPGEVTACGGIALMKVNAVQAVNGFNPQLICGEEPEMCLRMRRQGWKIWRLAVPMTYHDADMHHFSQWWKRMIRTGWAVAEGYALYGQAPEQYMQREYRSGWLWGLTFPLLSLALLWPSHGVSLLFLLVYPLLAVRIYQGRRRHGDSPAKSRLFALFITLSKLPQVLGQLKYWRLRWQGRTPQLIEYKATTPATPSPAQPIPALTTTSTSGGETA
ncbi:MAG: glycosyltransferase [Cyanobacteria bacterium J06632_22]